MMFSLAKRVINRIVAPTGHRFVRINHDGDNGRKATSYQFGVDPYSDIGLLSDDRGPEIILDVGAHRGETALEFARRFPGAQIHCFEPNPAAFQELQISVAHLPNVQTHGLALGDIDGAARLHLHSESATDSILQDSPSSPRYSPPGWVSPAGEVDVPIGRLSTFCTEHGIRRVDLLKIDVQGFETKVLEGAGEMLDPSKIRLIFLEVLFVSLYEDQAYFGDVYERLVGHGYRFAGLYQEIWDRDGSLLWGDALFR